MAKIKLKKQFRAFESASIKIDEEARTIELSFSSEVPVERYYGKEILDHSPGAMKLERLNAGANVIFNHDWDKVLGVVERAWLGSDKRGYAQIRFSKSPFADEKWSEVKDGILRNVSFGYEVKQFKLEVSSKDEGDTYRAMDWTPFEISVVTVPADFSVGIGRSTDADQEIEVEVLETEIEKPAAKAATRGFTMDPEEIKKLEEAKKLAVDSERARISSISAMCEKHGMGDLARTLIDGGKSLDEARGAVLEKLGARQLPVSGKESDIGMSPKEIRQFSFQRALNALANPTDRKAWEAAKYEVELSEAAQKHTGRSAKGILVPTDVLREKRDLVKGTLSAGGNLVATELLAGSFIEILRNRSVLQRAGAQSLNGLVGDISVPRQTGAATAYWVGEGVAITESQQAFDQVRMTPKTVGAFTDYSRKLLLQSSIDIETLIRNDLAAVIALEIDRVGLYGSGSSAQPAGLNGLAGLNTVNFAGANPTYAEVVQMETEIAADNADVGSMKYLVNARGRGALKTTEKAASTGMFIWEQGNTVNGYATEVSNQIVTTGGTDPDYWFGVWANCIMGMWSGLDLTVDPYAGATQGNVRVIAMQDMDLMFRRPEFFCKGANNP